MTDFNEVSHYIEKHKSVSIPELQRAFSADYFGMAQIIQKMVDDDILMLKDGVRYILTPSAEKKAKLTEQAEKNDEDDEDNYISELRKNLEERRRMLIERLRKEMESEDEDEDDDEDGDETDTLYGDDNASGRDIGILRRRRILYIGKRTTVGRCERGTHYVGGRRYYLHIR